jgi:hypothetical protein
VISSSSSSTAYTSGWYNSDTYNTYPWIQLNEYSTAKAEYDILYMADGYSAYKESFQRRGGNFVFINSGKLACTAD